jgi:hypothetical protein
MLLLSLLKAKKKLKMYNPKSKRTSKQIGAVKKKTLDGLTANKNIDDIRALAKLLNGHTSDISNINTHLSSVDLSILDLDNTKQDKIKLTTNGFFGPSTFVNNVLNVPDYSSGPDGLFAQTSDSIPITATTTEGTLIDGGVGVLTVPANSFKAGDSFVCMLSGIISSVNNETLRIKVKSGSVILGDSGLVTLPATTNKHWDLDIHFTIRRTGVAGTAQIMTSGALTYSKNSSNAFEGIDFSSLNNTTFNTTVPNTLDITVQWGSNNAGNSIYTQTFVLHKTY